MMKTKIVLLVVAFTLSNFGFSQKKNYLKEINEQVWQSFTTAFETKDAKLFKSIHDDSLIRVSANTNDIKSLAPYINNYKEQWERLNRSQTINFRFIERITNGQLASERGIYKFTLFPKTDQEMSYYGKFHVILKKIDGLWKLSVDYDSNENNNIDELTYESAYALDDYEQF